MDKSKLLAELAASVRSGGIAVVDLTETLNARYPTISLPPEFGQASPFRKTEISRYDGKGPAWYWNNFTMSEHTGTHFDAPIHWITGRDLPHNAVDTIRPKDFIAEACVVDCTKEAAADKGYILTVGKLEAFERAHGRIPQGAWVFMRTPPNWSRLRYCSGARSPIRKTTPICRPTAAIRPDRTPKPCCG